MNHLDNSLPFTGLDQGGNIKCYCWRCIGASEGGVSGDDVTGSEPNECCSDVDPTKQQCFISSF